MPSSQMPATGPYWVSSSRTIVQFRSNISCGSVRATSGGQYMKSPRPFFSHCTASSATRSRFAGELRLVKSDTLVRNR